MWVKDSNFSLEGFLKQKTCGRCYLLLGINPTKTAPESAYSLALYGIIFSECWLEPPACPLHNPEIPIHVSVSLTNPRLPESPNKGKMPKSPVLKVTTASSLEVTTRPSPRLSTQFDCTWAQPWLMADMSPPLTYNA